MHDQFEGHRHRRAHHRSQSTGEHQQHGAGTPGKTSQTDGVRAAPVSAVVDRAIKRATGAIAMVRGMRTPLHAAIAHADYLESGRLAFEIRMAIGRARTELADVIPHAHEEGVRGDLLNARDELDRLASSLQPTLAMAPALEELGAGSEAAETAWRQQQIKGGGDALVADGRWGGDVARFGQALGVADAEVRTDATSRALTEAEGASGVAVGRTIHLHPERVRPNTSEGREILVHELVHLAQARLPADQDVGRAAAEAEAADLARAIVAGGQARPRRAIDLSRAAADTHANQQAPSEAEVRAAVARVQLRIEDAFATLLAEPDRRDEIIQIATVSATDLTAAALLIEGTNGGIDAVREVDALSEAVAKVERWIEGRPAHAALFEQFLPVIRQTNRLRKRLGLGLIGAMSAPAMPMTVVSQEKQEASDHTAKVTLFRDKLSDRFRAIEAGATQFSTLVTLADPAPSTPAWLGIARDLLVAVIGNLAGPAGKIVAGVGKSAGHFIEASVSDWVQASAHTIAEAATADVATDDKRDQAVFVRGLTLTHSALESQARDVVTERVRRGTLTMKELDVMIAELVAASADDLAQQGYLEAAHGYAKLKAYRSLGTETDLPTGKTVSAMDNYLGVQDPRTKTIVGDRSGSRGVAKLSVRVLASGELELESFNIHGLNQEMASAVLARAGNQLGAMDLPMELEFHTDRQPGVAVTDYSSRMAVDEQGRIRATSEWELFDEYLSEIHQQLSTPDNVLGILRSMRIPGGVAV